MFGNLQEILDDIYDAPEGPEIAAFFDYDNTLISGFSATSFFREQITSGAMSPKDFSDQLTAATQYSLGRIGFSGFMSETMKTMRGQAEYKFIEFSERVFKNHVAGSIYPEAREILAAHADKGHTIAIVSSATRYQIEPAARELDIEYVLCTELEVEDGVFTGDVVSPTCYGEGKLTAAEDFSDEMETKLEKSFFYTDSHEDLPLLEAVGRPRVLNPNSKLARIARAASWPVYRFNSRNRPSISQIARMGLSVGALPASILTTLPIWALTGNKRDTLNAAVNLWSDFSLAATGVRLNIEGEENLWAQRPAVFIFNHQSSLDAIIMCKLLQRDFTAIGKKEIGNFPIIGPAFKFADVILIDRDRSKKAIEQIKPVIHAIQDQGLSLALAPEGTRSPAHKLGRFKKGAFHISMQAGVPIVPIVIHNSSDMLPKGHNIARSGVVDVTVLPPVDTSGWSTRNLDNHVKEIRNMYLEILGQDS